ncbi:MAG TPA: hypothetical protein PKA62_15430 [Thermoanaerobaculia bacterium]|nr:hypothetical protein [Thermoanaerobaculia bacterium]
MRQADVAFEGELIVEVADIIEPAPGDGRMDEPVPSPKSPD